MAPSLGGQKKIRGPTFRMTFLGKNFHFNANISNDFFLSSTIFCLSLLSEIQYITYMTLFLIKKNIYFIK